MKRFGEFLTESVRQGLPSIESMSHEQFHNLTRKGHVPLHSTTEKTDGMTHLFGHDEHGFYSQSSGSGKDKMRKGQDYIDRAHRRAKETGKPVSLGGAQAFAHVHDTLHSNEKLQQYLKDKAKKHGETKVKGELFYKPHSRPSDTHPKEVKFIGTSYDPSHMGHVGKIVVHSHLPENSHHDVEHIKKHLSDHHINFDDDHTHIKPTKVDVGPEKKKFDSLNHELINSRTTPKNKADKLKEVSKFDKIKQSASKKVDTHVKKLGISPKWGTGSEGLVVHPEPGTDHPRFKVTSNNFRKYRDEYKGLTPEQKAKKFKDLNKK